MAAHGTGAGLPTVDEMITRLRLVTPALGALEVSPDRNASLLRFARVGLGALGVVSDMTLRCVPRHRLHERTFVVDSYEQLRATHADRLRRFRHVRYMWLPYTGGKVVVVVSDPVDDAEADVSSVVRDYTLPPSSSSAGDEAVVAAAAAADPTLPLKHLLSAKRGGVPLEEFSARMADRHTHARTHTHAHTHARTHARTHTHTIRTHACEAQCPPPPSPPPLRVLPASSFLLTPPPSLPHEWTDALSRDNNDNNDDNNNNNRPCPSQTCAVPCWTPATAAAAPPAAAATLALRSWHGRAR